MDPGPTPLPSDLKAVWAHSPDPWLVVDPSEETCYDDVVAYRYFAGVVESVDKELIPGNPVNVLNQTIRCVDYNALTDRYLVNHYFTSSRTARYLFQWVAEHYLNDDSVGFRCIPSEGVYLSPVDWAHMKVAGVFQQIGKVAGWVFYIDPYKELRAHNRGYKVAPWQIRDADVPQHFQRGTLRSSGDSGGYANALYARLRVRDDEDWVTVLVSASDVGEIADRAAVEGGNGYHELHVDLTEAISVEQGLDQIQGKLDECATLGETITYTTRTAGLRAGMVQVIECSDMDVDANYLITSVNLSTTERVPFYKVTATSWKSNKDFTNFLDAALTSKTNWRQEEVIAGEAWPMQATDGVKVGDVVQTFQEGTGPWKVGTSQLGWDTELG